MAMSQRERALPTGDEIFISPPVLQADERGQGRRVKEPSFTDLGLKHAWTEPPFTDDV
jgi:hypothetical protein